MEWLPLSASEKKDFAAAAKAFRSEANVVYKKFVSYHIKLGKRSKINPKVLSVL